LAASFPLSRIICESRDGRGTQAKNAFALALCVCARVRAVLLAQRRAPFSRVFILR